MPDCARGISEEDKVWIRGLESGQTAYFIAILWKKPVDRSWEK